MSDIRRIQVSKINVILLTAAWIYAIAMLHLYGYSNAEFIPIEITSHDEEEVVSETEDTSSNEEIALATDEKSLPNTDEVIHLEEESNKMITPPNIEIASAAPTPNLSSTEEKKKVGKIRVNATYESEPREIFPWLMARGVRILLFDKYHAVFAEVNRDGFIEQAYKGLKGGVQRAATAEVNNFVKSRLPSNTKHAVVWWPDTLWIRILDPLKAYDAHSAKVSYRVQNDALVVTIHSVITDQGIITPAKSVYIR